jgi:AcrR family transcriptional regulator
MPTKTFLRLRDEKQEQIMRAAIRECVENGFERAKVSDIARNAGVAKGSIYQYFEDKKALYVYCAEWSLDVFMKKLGERSHIRDMDIFEYYRDSITKEEVMEEEHELIVFMQAIMREPGLLEPSMRAMYAVGNPYMQTLIENSQKRGLVRTDISGELLMEYFIAITERFSARLMKRNLDFTKPMSKKNAQAAQDEVDQMLKLLQEGMGVHNVSASGKSHKKLS